MTSRPVPSDTAWQQTVERLAARGLSRSLDLVPDDVGVVDMASNNYLGLANDSRLIEAARAALEKWGVGARASRLVTGHLLPHQQLEEQLADFKQKEAALVFSSGYATNVGVLTALAGPRDIILADRLNHASIIDGARQSGATLRFYHHADPDHLRHRLESTQTDRGQQVIVTDGVFSMDGDLAPLPALAELADEFGAVLVVDDAHATGVVGPQGRGTPAHFGVDERVPVYVGTLSKALGAQGGFVAGSRTLINLLINTSRSFIYSTGLAPSIAAAATKAVEVARSEGSRRQKVQKHLANLRAELSNKSYRIRGEAPAPLIAVEVGDPEETMHLARKLEASGIIAPAIRPPTVPDGTSRIRLAPMATHTEADIQRVIDAF